MSGPIFGPRCRRIRRVTCEVQRIPGLRNWDYIRCERLGLVVELPGLWNCQVDIMTTRCTTFHSTGLNESIIRSQQGHGSFKHSPDLHTAYTSNIRNNSLATTALESGSMRTGTSQSSLAPARSRPGCQLWPFKPHQKTIAMHVTQSRDLEPGRRSEQT